MTSRCGTDAGYAAHIRANETTCRPCRDAHNRATKRYEVGLALGTPATRLVDATGTIRRLQALSYAGWPQNVIWRAAGLQYRHLARLVTLRRIDPHTATRIAEVTERFWNKPPPTSTRAEKAASSKARTIARRSGWAPMAAYDDIDNPNDRPQGIRQETAA